MRRLMEFRLMVSNNGADIFGMVHSHRAFSAQRIVMPETFDYAGS